MRVVLDTNIYISFALDSAALRPLRSAWLAGRFRVYVSTYLLAEVGNVLTRSKFIPYLTPGSAEELTDLLVSLGQPMTTRLPHSDFSDPKDCYLLAMLRDSDAELLVTGDKTLLALESFDNKPILPPAGFLARLKE